MAIPAVAPAVPGIEIVTVDPAADGEGQTWSLTLQLLVLMTLLTLLPSIVLMFTSFTRIIVVLAILRQALGMATTPPNQVLIGLALFLTMFVMAPVWTELYSEAVTPYIEESIELDEALERAREPIHRFMRRQVRENDLALFADLGGHENGFESVEDVPFSILVPAFLTSELKTAFMIGFLVFIPFVIIDLVVASLLMSMGMMMLSPMLISLPFKLMLFVVVDGWGMIMGTLAASFYTGGV
jgi:flagellar biosynthetic protein FliP